MVQFVTKEVLRVKKNTTKKLAKRKKKIEKRVERKNWESQPKPMLTATDIHYEVDGRHKGIPCGGIGAVHLMAKKSDWSKTLTQI